ncbi:unnamed protein product [Bursaphelenchus okinawaensis]|uniref:RNA helicase n=1 Tax=Bursaphelenchus okinawaensis TaxID=465554 RepID=A0A811JV76_9BILA|nr:unnamed protein product [Bursaphelenchus okinawaensis]CAG9085205.1 unnamed protein product [Bursaphelenchus okinawaensis]
MPINLRPYQAELAEGAVNGQNTLICAPTNSGKTLTAVYICRQRWYSALRNGAKFKAVLFVPTRVLVEQQCKYFKKFMKQLKVISICGDDTTSQPQRQNILNNDVIVMTPMVLLNILNQQSENVNDQVTINMFTLLIFDECHHVNEKHPYNEIMNFYHDRKSFGSSAGLPQVIGLTASIGAKDAKDVNDTRDYCSKICANLDARRINRVRKNLDALAKHSPLVMDEIKLCENMDIGCIHTLQVEATAVLEDIINYLKELLKESEITSLKRQIKNINVYSSICALQRTVGLTHMDDYKRQKANDMIEWIKIVNNGLCVARILDKFTAVEDIKKAYEALKHRTGYSNQHYTKTKYLTGYASAEEAGLNKAKQNEVVRQFRVGEIKIMCCTSVADEGLDIPECNVVIKYNDTTNEVAHVQRKGRGRAENARSILIAENDTVRRMEESNQLRVTLMKMALDEIDNNRILFEEKVENYISLNNEERRKRRIAAADESRAYRNRRNDYVIACKNCNAFIIHSTKLFKEKSFYVAADEAIWDRVDTSEYVKIDRLESAEPTVGKIKCKNQTPHGKCGHVLGSVVVCKPNKTFLPILSCSELVFVEVSLNYNRTVTPSGQREQKKKWVKVEESLFKPRELTSYERAVMAKVRPKLEFSNELSQVMRSWSETSISSDFEVIDRVM